MAKDPRTGAMTSRTVVAYDLPQLRLFFKTGQPSGVERFDGLGERKANISCHPYHTLSTEQRAELTGKSENIERSHVAITLDAPNRKINFYDEFTQVVSVFSFDVLDEDVLKQVDIHPVEQNIEHGPK